MVYGGLASYIISITLAFLEVEVGFKPTTVSFRDSRSVTELLDRILEPGAGI